MAETLSAENSVMQFLIWPGSLHAETFVMQNLIEPKSIGYTKKKNLFENLLGLWNPVAAETWRVWMHEFKHLNFNENKSYARNKDALIPIVGNDFQNAAERQFYKTRS